MVSKRSSDYLPCGNEIVLPRGRNQDPRADYAFQRRPGLGEGSLHVLMRLRGQAGVIPDAAVEPSSLSGHAPARKINRDWAGAGAA
jgi:hypothetical protein